MDWSLLTQQLLLITLLGAADRLRGDDYELLFNFIVDRLVYGWLMAALFGHPWDGLTAPIMLAMFAGMSACRQDGATPLVPRWLASHLDATIRNGGNAGCCCATPGWHCSPGVRSGVLGLYHWPCSTRVCCWRCLPCRWRPGLPCAIRAHAQATGGIRNTCAAGLPER